MFKAPQTLSSGVWSTEDKGKTPIEPKDWCTQCTQTVRTQSTIFKAPQTLNSGVRSTGKKGKTLIETQSLVYAVYSDCLNTAYSV